MDSVDAVKEDQALTKADGETTSVESKEALSTMEVEAQYAQEATAGPDEVAIKAGVTASAETKPIGEAHACAGAKEADETKAAAEAKAAEDDKAAAEARAAAEAKATEEANAAAQAKAVAEARAVEDAKVVAEAKVVDEAQDAKAATAAAKANEAADAHTAVDANAEESKMAAEAQAAVQAKEAEDAQAAAAAKVAEETKAAAEATAAEDAKVGAAAQAAEANASEEAEAATATNASAEARAVEDATAAAEAKTAAEAQDAMAATVAAEANELADVQAVADAKAEVAAEAQSAVEAKLAEEAHADFEAKVAEATKAAAGAKAAEDAKAAAEARAAAEAKATEEANAAADAALRRHKEIVEAEAMESAQAQAPEAMVTEVVEIGHGHIIEEPAAVVVEEIVTAQALEHAEISEVELGDADLLTAEVVVVPPRVVMHRLDDDDDDDHDGSFDAEVDQLPNMGVVSSSSPVPPHTAAEVPLAVVPPRGLAGIFDDYDPDATLDTSGFPSGTVLLNVYDVGSDEDEVVQRVNRVGTGNNNLLVGGVFHGGVEIYGVEWCYGSSGEGQTGVAHLAPRTHQQHSYRTTVPLGRTQLSEEQVRGLLWQMAQTWRGSDYHLIHHNCLNFCNALCKELGVRRIPGWVDRVPRVASSLDQVSRSAMDNIGRTSELVRTVTADLQGIAQTVGTDIDRTLRGDAEDNEPNIVVDTVEEVRRGSERAVEIARNKTADLLEGTADVVEAAMNVDLAQTAQELSDAWVARTRDVGESAQELLGFDPAERAQENAQALSQTVQESSQAVAERAQELAERARQGTQELLGEDLSNRAQDLTNDISAKAQEMQEQASAQAQVLSSSIWKWGSGLRQAASRVWEEPSANSRQGNTSQDPRVLLPTSQSRRLDGVDPPPSGYLKPQAATVAEDDQE